jgi:hypothetical protein
MGISEFFSPNSGDFATFFPQKSFVSLELDFLYKHPEKI